MTADEMETKIAEAVQEAGPALSVDGEDRVTVTPGLYLDRDEGQWALLLECRWPADPNRMMEEGFGMAAIVTDAVRRLLRGETEISWVSAEEDD